MEKKDTDLQFIVKEDEAVTRFKLSEAVALLGWLVHFTALLLIASGVIAPAGWLTATLLWPLAVALFAGVIAQGRRLE